MRTVFAAVVIALIPAAAFAQSPGAPPIDASLATPTGHEVSVGLGHYDYVEPGNLRISIHGAKFAGEYTGTFSLSRRRHVFARANAKAAIGSTTYDGHCAPWLITPNSASPNGYLLDLGPFTPCSETGDKDWYLEGRALVGKDFIGGRWSWSPESGLGVRHLSNSIAGVTGFRTDNYLYLPLGITARTNVASRTLGVNLEYDQLIRGWQTTRDAKLGSGAIPATTSAPAFTIDSFTDISFTQHGGWAARASAKYQLNRSFSVEPYYVYWHVDASPVNTETVTFTVNAVRATETFGAYEPVNFTNEFGVRFSLRFF